VRKKDAPPFPMAIAKATVSRDLVLLADTGRWIAGSPIALRGPGHPKYPQFGGCSRSFGDGRGGWKKGSSTPLATRPALNYPDPVALPIYEVAR
jgi:hypothetical protein